MKSVLLILLFAFVSFAASAQPDKEARKKREAPSAYLFADFYEATVLLKSGNKLAAAFNYHMGAEQMIYRKGGSLQALDMPGIDTIYLGGKKFIPFGEAFCEVRKIPAGVLYIRHHVKVQDRRNPVGYGGHSQTSTVTSLRGTTMLGGYHEFAPRTKYDIRVMTGIWIRRGNALHETTSSRKLQQAFPAQKSIIKQLVKEHKTNFSRPEDVIKLLSLLE